VDKKLNSSLKRQGFIQAAGVALYCSIIGILFWKGNEIFGNVPNYAGPVAFLLLFLFSALICGLLVFYQPYKLFFDEKRKEAADLVLFTTGFLFFFFLIFLFVALLAG
jgi:hypothetical protein